MLFYVNDVQNFKPKQLWYPSHGPKVLMRLRVHRLNQANLKQKRVTTSSVNISVLLNLSKFIIYVINENSDPPQNK